MKEELYRVLDTGEHDAVTLWTSTMKQSNHSVNMSPDKPINMMHLIVHMAAVLKVRSKYCTYVDLEQSVRSLFSFR